ncbi:Mucin-associated surface protein (MASP), subgroup S008, partial [Trypanosoma cruzi]
MAMMMTGRVLLVCALCVLWCGGAVVVSAAGGDGDNDGRGVVGESLLESAENGMSLPGSPESRIKLQEVSNPPSKHVEEAHTPAKESSGEEDEAEDEVTVKSEERQQEEGENALKVNERKTPELLVKQNETPQAREEERSLTATPIKGSPTTPGPQAPTLQVPPPPAAAASADGEADGGPVGVEGPISGPPSSGASSSPISNNGDASGNNGGALPTQDTTSLKNNEQSGPTTSSTSTSGSGDHVQNKADKDDAQSSEEQHHGLETGNTNVVPALSEAAPQTAKTITTANTTDTANAQNSDSSTAVSHTTSPLLLLLVVACAAAAVVAA